MAIAAQLFRLEQLDAELDQRQSALAEVRQRLARDPVVDEVERRLDVARKRESAALLEQRRLEGELADLETRLKRDHNRLYGGTIVDSRELASLEREIEHYRAQCSAMEERLLAVMEQVETLQAEVESLSRQANTLRQQRETDRPALEQQAEEMTDALAGLRDERDTLAAQLDARSLAAYSRLRKASGHAISQVRDGVCQWCRVVIPPKDIQHARAGQLVSCTNCGRVLYAG